MDTFVKLENITKIYHMGEVEIRAVDGIDFSDTGGMISGLCSSFII